MSEEEIHAGFVKAGWADAAEVDGCLGGCDTEGAELAKRVGDRVVGVSMSDPSAGSIRITVQAMDLCWTDSGYTCTA